MVEASKTETRRFDADVARLISIVTHSLYSNRDIFLRELIANAADACEKRRYLAQADQRLLPEEGFGIEVAIDAKAGQLAVADNGVGMSHQELIDNLGTIAASGTVRFLEQVAAGQAAPTQIGQFGVGFYSAFMVADRVTVETRRAGGEEPGWRWQSTGGEDYEIEPLPRPMAPGTRVVLHLKRDAREYLEPSRLESLVKQWCDHIALPIRLAEGRKEPGEPLNRASALWSRPKSEITDEQAAAFYHDIAHAFDKPWRWLHVKAEGAIEWTALLFIPSERPFALFHPDRKADLRLYVKRVFITDGCKELLPAWLRFVKGVVDSEDLPLNVSRELLQANPLLAKIRAGVVKRVLADLGKAAEEDKEGFETFWDAFGPVLKEGLYEDAGSREALLGLVRLRSTKADGWTTLADYVARMQPGQEAIYTATGENLERLKQSPHLEGFRARGLEVLLLTDPVDEFWLPAVAEYQGKAFRSVTKGQADLERFASESKGGEAKSAEDAPDLGRLLAFLKLTLAKAVKDVRSSTRLADSPVCLVAAEGDLDLNLERLLHAHGQIEKQSPRILEVNPRHKVIHALSQRLQQGQGEAVEDVAWLLFEEARLVEGENL
ncbi:MAG TPA: molecular chaperone HtpG, partial [Kiloniellales bacterium]|nr:molecular chaperone HtpG [Kiloniellales bacterium]